MSRTTRQVGNECPGYSPRAKSRGGRAGPLPCWLWPEPFSRGNGASNCQHKAKSHCQQFTPRGRSLAKPGQISRTDLVQSKTLFYFLRSFFATPPNKSQSRSHGLTQQLPSRTPSGTASAQQTATKALFDCRITKAWKAIGRHLCSCPSSSFPPAHKMHGLWAQDIRGPTGTHDSGGAWEPMQAALHPGEGGGCLRERGAGQSSSH